MVKQFSNWYFDYGWIVLMVIFTGSFDVISSRVNKSLNYKINWIITLSIIYIVIMSIAIYGKHHI